jgi:aryl-alcohol dehydrogenase-like predicted oxidoreductase
LRELKQNQIANTGIEISELGLGTVKFGRNTGVKYPAAFTIPDHQTLRVLLDKAKALGINYLDTAPAYGSSEATLGELLQTDNQDWVISSKVGEYYTGDVSQFDFSAEATTRSVKASLKKLRREALDIVYVHSDGNDQEVIEHTAVLETLSELKQHGLIRAIGFSGKIASQTALAIPYCDVFMIALNEADRSQHSLIEQCHANNKGVVIKKALASGHSENPAQALRYANQFAGVTSTIVGTISTVHLEDNVQAITDV